MKINLSKLSGGEISDIEVATGYGMRDLMDMEGTLLIGIHYVAAKRKNPGWTYEESRDIPLTELNKLEVTGSLFGEVDPPEAAT